MKTTTYTKQQVIDFINAQPDDRVINFSESEFGRGAPSAKCGCLLVHLFQKTYPEVTRGQTIECGHKHAEAGHLEIETPWLITNRMTDITTYGQLKLHLDQLFTE